MKKLEVKEISLAPADFYNFGAYPSEGIYLVAELVVPQISTTLLNVRNGCVIYIGEGVDFNFIETEPKLEISPNPKSNGLVSEELFFKAMSLMVNKGESYKK